MIFDFAVFGGGVVGASIFNKLTELGKKVVLIEKNSDVATGASKANSGLVHAGFDCKPNTLKARLNVWGNALMPMLAKRLGIEYIQCGAVVVGNDKKLLEELLARGKKNGVVGLTILEDKDLHEKVPNLSSDIHYGLFAETAGLISPYLLTIALAEEAVINGGKVVFNFDTNKIVFKDNVFKITNGKKEIYAKQVINACGEGYNQIAKLLKTEQYTLQFRRGEYYVLDHMAKDFVNLTVFPMPSKTAGKGILATPTVHGNILFGPTSQISDNKAITTNQGLEDIKGAITKQFVNPPFKYSIRQYSGIRVSAGDDFIVEQSKLNNKVINICGINSPGLSSAPAIAEYVATLLGSGKKKHMKPRYAYENFLSLPISKQNQMIKQNPSYGRIVCRCEKITEGEIIDAIKSPLKPKSIDGIKRRVRAGMGRCQGGFCGNVVAKLISKYGKIPLSKVKKENLGSEIYIYDIKKTPNFAKGGRL